jgi:trypsin-like peptidase
MWKRASSWHHLWLAAGVVACGSPSEADGLGRATQAFVNGPDDRQEYFELTRPDDRAVVRQSAVALVPVEIADALAQGALDQVITWGELNDLCGEEPFEDQPSAAFCSGVLVDWDLVLTSGHCTDFLALSDYRIVFGYYYGAPDQLEISPEDIYEPAEVITSRLDPSGQDERVDFAWIRLRRPARVPHWPAVVHARERGVAVGDPVISVGAGGGVPIKLDDGALVRDIRADIDDYFVADTDTSEGSSGGGIFDAELALVGTLARGAPDFVPRGDGCWISDRESDPALANEQFTYVHRAVEQLCATGSTSALCDPACGTPCNVSSISTEPVDDGESGCSLNTRPNGAASLALPLLALLLLQKRQKTQKSRRPV